MAARKRSLEANLMALSLTAGGALALLLLSTFGVVYALGGRLERFQSLTLPAQQGVAGMQRSVARLFEREVKVQATSTRAQLEALRDRRSIEQELRQSEKTLTDALPRLLDSAEADKLRASLSKSSVALLGTDHELFSSVERRHAAQEALDHRSRELSSALQKLTQDARATAGVAHLAYVLQLRRLAQGGAQADVHKVVFGEERAQQEAAEQVVITVLQLGQIVGEIALAHSQDELNSIAANELSQNLLRGRTRLTRLLGSLGAEHPSLERTRAMQQQFESVATGIADEQNPASLLRVRRDILREASRAVELQAQLVSSEDAFSKGLGEVQGVVAAEVAHSTRLARTTRWVVQLVSFCLLGAAAWFGLRSARRVKESLSGLRAQNQELESLSLELRGMNEGLETLVAARSLALAKRERELRLVLDSMEEALVSVGLDGALTGECSKSALAWFGQPEPEQRVWTYLFRDAPALREGFEIGFEQVTDALLPFEAAVGCLPARFERTGRTYSIEYRPVHEGAQVKSVLLVISDITAVLAAERGEREAREEQALLSGLLRDKQGFQLFLQDCRGLLRELQRASEREPLLRALHTLKGNTAMYGVSSVAKLCHELEDEMLESATVPVAQRFQAITAQFEERVASVEELAGGNESIELSERDYDELKHGLANRQSVEELLPVVEAWRWLQISQVLGRLGGQARRVAVRLDKSVEIALSHGDLRIAPGPLDDFFASLVHVVRNSLDHGIESAAERKAQGKPELGRLELRSFLADDGKLVVEIEDDGRGIDFEALEAAAARAGHQAKSRDELVSAMLQSGVTTREEATELSGRGVGLAAVAHACRQAGGELQVRSDRGRGTQFRFAFPAQRVQVRVGRAGSKVSSSSKLRTAARAS